MKTCFSKTKMSIIKIVICLFYILFFKKHINQSINISGRLILYRFFDQLTSEPALINIIQNQCRVFHVLIFLERYLEWTQTLKTRIHILKIPSVCKVSWCWRGSNPEPPLPGLPLYTFRNTLKFQIPPLSYLLYSQWLDNVEKIAKLCRCVTLVHFKRYSSNDTVWKN